MYIYFNLKENFTSFQEINNFLTNSANHYTINLLFFIAHQYFTGKKNKECLNVKLQLITFSSDLFSVHKYNQQIQ